MLACLLAFGSRAEEASKAAALPPIRLAMIEGLSGPFAAPGEAVYRNLLWAVERVNGRGGVKLPGGARRLELLRLDSEGKPDVAVALLRSAAEQGSLFVLQGNSSAVAAALIAGLEQHNRLAPSRMLFLNYSAVDPALTNELCSFWHFRFDAHSGMRLAALINVLREDAEVHKLYLIGQDYSFGRQVLRDARTRIAAARPDIEIVGEELHPVGSVEDFRPYAARIRASGAQAVLTGNWGSDLTSLVKAAKKEGVKARFYTFYGNALGVPAALGEAGVGQVLAVSEWHPNVATPASKAFYADFRQRFPRPQDDYVHARLQVLVEMAVRAIEKAGSTDAAAVARALEGLEYDGATLGFVHQASMRVADHQLMQRLFVGAMAKAGTPEVPFDIEGSGFGFATVRELAAEEVAQPHHCQMQRPP